LKGLKLVIEFAAGLSSWYHSFSENIDLNAPLPWQQQHHF
jgi:hypothetical protein